MLGNRPFRFPVGSRVTGHPEVGLFGVNLTRNARSVLLKNSARSRPQDGTPTTRPSETSSTQTFGHSVEVHETTRHSLCHVTTRRHGNIRKTRRQSQRNGLCRSLSSKGRR